MKEASELNYRNKLENHLWREFLKSLQASKSAGELGLILDRLLTVSEKSRIAKRWAALVLLKEGKSYKEIGRILWTGPQKISALKKSLCGDSVYRSGRYWEELSNGEKKKRIKALPPQNQLDYWLNFPWPTKAGRGRWRFLDYQG